MSDVPIKPEHSFAKQINGLFSMIGTSIIKELIS